MPLSKVYDFCILEFIDLDAVEGSRDNRDNDKISMPSSMVSVSVLEISICEILTKNKFF